MQAVLWLVTGLLLVTLYRKEKQIRQLQREIQVNAYYLADAEKQLDRNFADHVASQIIRKD